MKVLKTTESIIENFEVIFFNIILPSIFLLLVVGVVISIKSDSQIVFAVETVNHPQVLAWIKIQIRISSNGLFLSETT